MATADPFDHVAAKYDAWYDSPEGRALFDQEVEALLLVKGRVPGRWLEVGVGTGRFASAFGVEDGVDPSQSMRNLAAQRGIHAREGAAEALPYDDGSFDGVLVVATLCFTTDPAQSLREFLRVLRPEGTLVIGLIPSASPWGQEYARKGAAGHPLFSHARFLDVDETVRMAADAGLILTDAASALLQPPGRAPAHSHRVERGAVPGAGFVALRFRRRGRFADAQGGRSSPVPHPAP
ncbi:MAG: methyltransferase domain-containing protein [Dehalococcoidia bacterium]|jgi:ubiquinone/menaquinone biosynthesis C-methylase UbiE|nr:methyltransferase domain-containing protein [Dehalococcoidia bacterium]